MMYSPRSMTARNPNLLGQPFSKNTRFSARQSPLIALVESRHAPGWVCSCKKNHYRCQVDKLVHFKMLLKDMV